MTEPSTTVPSEEPSTLPTEGDPACFVDPQLTWENLYLAFYVTSLLSVVVLLALFVASVMRIKSKRMMRGFWIAVIPHALNMINGIISYFMSPTGKAINLMNFLWAFCSATEHWGVVYMVYIRVESGLLMEKWKEVGLQALVAIVFCITLADQLYWAIRAIDDSSLGYHIVLVYLNGVYPLMMDLGLYGLLAYTLHKNRAAFNSVPRSPGETSLAKALFITQVVRIAVFLGVEAAGCAVWIFNDDLPIVLNLVYNVLKPTRPFLIVTDTDRLHAITSRATSQQLTMDSAVHAGKALHVGTVEGKTVKSAMANMEEG
ncbi:hypothetical protein HK104_010475 [Borealophlyctis nickersoniae]|nr:hypothetical protein HK104_010475 [Borealophlyctis nickersoniae]